MRTYLHEHDYFGAECCAPVAWDANDFEELALPHLDAFFRLEKFGHVEQIACGLDLVVAQSAHGIVCSMVAAFG
jgi:hypothetical protein